MPVDVFILIAMSRWAMARAFLAVSATRGGIQRAKPFENLAIKIYRSSLRYGSVKTECERQFMENLDASLGFQTSETKDLIEQCRKFAAEVDGQ